MFQTIIPGLGTVAPADTTALSNVSKDIAELKSLSFGDLIDRLANDLVTFAINLAIAIFVFYVGRFVIRKIYKLVATIFVRRQIDSSLSTFMLSLINIVLYFILIVTVIGILGIETTSFLALFASAGVAIGMALSGTLQNFAGGVLILLLKPYRIGDYIEVQGYAGTVREIQIFSTIINTYDNKSISIPNGALSTGSVNNWSREKYRRVTWSIDISYGDDVTVARQVILDMFAADDRVIKAEQTDSIVDITGNGDSSMLHTQTGDNIEVHDADTDDADTTQGTTDDADDLTPPKKPTLLDRILHRHRKTRQAYTQWEKKRDARLHALMPKVDRSPKVLLNELGSSAVTLQVRAWTQTADYWNVFYYYNERFYNELPHHGLHFPFPQLDVHLPAK